MSDAVLYPRFVAIASKNCFGGEHLGVFVDGSVDRYSCSALSVHLEVLLLLLLLLSSSSSSLLLLLLLLLLLRFYQVTSSLVIKQFNSALGV